MCMKITTENFLKADGLEGYPRLATLLGLSLEEFKSMPLRELSQKMQQLEIELEAIREIRESNITSYSVIVDGKEYSFANDLGKVKMSAYMDINAVEDLPTKLAVLALADTDYTAEQVMNLSQSFKSLDIKHLLPVLNSFFFVPSNLFKDFISSLQTQLLCHKVIQNRLRQHSEKNGDGSTLYGRFLMKAYKLLIIFSLKRQKKFSRFYPI